MTADYDIFGEALDSFNTVINDVSDVLKSAIGAGRDTVTGAEKTIGGLGQNVENSFSSIAWPIAIVGGVLAFAIISKR